MPNRPSVQRLFKTTILLMLVALVTSCGHQSASEPPPLRLAVAANFAGTLRQLCTAYQRDHGQSFRISVGSTGGLSAQIKAGAPFDLFFAADRSHPAQLEEQGLGIAGTRRSYAEGQLVLWSAAHAADTIKAALEQAEVDHIAIANPRTAPYGLAAQQFLEGNGLWQQLMPKLRQAQSIGQAQQFIASGAADWGFIARSMTNTTAHGSILPIERTQHDPIIQQMIVLKDTQAIRHFWQWVQNSPQAQKLITQAGYLIPQAH